MCKWGWIAGDANNDLVGGDWESALLQKIDLHEVRHLARGGVQVAGTPVDSGVTEEASKAWLTIY